MNSRPATIEELSNIIRRARATGQQIESMDLRGLNRVLEHLPEDMTATVQAGISLTDLQTELGRRGQWLPLDPPNPEQLTIAALLANNANGPRRFGYGTVRDYVIGIKAVMADGQVIRAGGKVVKNVAGYDLMKLFIGSGGSLGVLVETTFKVLPLPESERFVQAEFPALEEADTVVAAILDSELAPTVLDLHNVGLENGRFVVVLGFAGTQEETAYQAAQAGKFGFGTPSSLEYQKRFFSSGASTYKSSVLPSKLIEQIRKLNGSTFVARAGNGVIYHLVAIGQPAPSGPKNLQERVKDQFDPMRVFPRR